MTYAFDRFTLYNQDERGNKTAMVVFNAPILRMLVLDYGLCVITEPNANTARATNLFMLNLEGKEQWCAEASFTAGDKNVFVDIKAATNDAKRLLAWDWDGNKYVFDAASGKELSRDFLK